MLKEISSDFCALVNEPLDSTLIRKNYGGEKYITGYTVVRLLNKLTDGAWSWEVDKTWTEPCHDKKGDHTIYHLMGTLTLYFREGDKILEVKKQGVAGKDLSASVKNAENIYKALETLALRKAASYAGIGAELWLNSDENDWFEQAGKIPVWTDELFAEYSDTWQEIGDVQEKCGMTDDDMNGVVKAWNNKYEELADVAPEDINKFLDFLREQLDTDEGAA